MIEHYIEFSACPFDGDLHFIMNKLFNRLHGIISKEKLNLGLAFPHMSSRSPGKTVRVFGKLDELEIVKKNAGIENLISRGFVEISAIKQIPENAEPVGYNRIRNPEKVTATGISRKMKRLRLRTIARGEEWTGETHKRVLQKLQKKQNRVSETPYFLVERNGKHIPIFIKKAMLTGKKLNPNPKFNRYGLGNDTHRSLNAVYDF